MLLTGAGRRPEAILVAAIAVSMAAGVLLPSIGMIFAPYLLVWLGALLFLNLIKLKTSDLINTFTKPKQLAVSSAIKLVALPLGMYAVAYLVYPDFALPVLLLSGISSGLGAPFVANIVGSGSRLAMIVGMILVTSLAVPFILPSMVHFLFQASFQIPMLDMVLLLSSALIVPLAAGWLVRKYMPAISRIAEENSFPASVALVVLINFAMFAKFADYFYTEQLFLAQTTATAFLLFAAYGLTGYLSTFSARRQDKVAGMISMTYINNVLVAVFASQFFGPQVAALAALYNVPYYAMIIPIRKILQRL